MKRAMEYIGVWALLLLPICLFITALVVLAAGHFEAATVTLCSQLDERLVRNPIKA